MSEKYDYRKGVEEDLLRYIYEKGGLAYWFNDADYMLDGEINDFCNKDQEYTFFHSGVKKDQVISNFELLQEALRYEIYEVSYSYSEEEKCEMLLQKILNDDWGYFDWIIRHYLRSSIWEEIIDEFIENGELGLWFPTENVSTKEPTEEQYILLDGSDRAEAYLVYKDWRSAQGYSLRFKKGNENGNE